MGTAVGAVVLAPVGAMVGGAGAERRSSNWRMRVTFWWIDEEEIMVRVWRVCGRLIWGYVREEREDADGIVPGGDAMRCDVMSGPALCLEMFFDIDKPTFSDRFGSRFRSGTAGSRRHSASHAKTENKPLARAQTGWFGLANAVLATIKDAHITIYTNLPTF